MTIVKSYFQKGDETMRGNQNNADLREFAKKANVCFWQVAQLWNVSESYMTRLFRREMTIEERERFIAAVDQLRTVQA
jgi:hypothetical protein